MSARLGAPVILDLWASNAAQWYRTLAAFTDMVTDTMAARGSCTGCPHLLHLPESRTARCAREGLRKISDAYLDGDAPPSWCGLREGA